MSIEIAKEEKQKAAFALNLCTVSVSQIVDYQDINILKQEYDAILNNLNLREIVKDEALLSAITSIMDVITFYLMQEGDKAMAEKEYQHRMKNAIWDSMSGMGMMVAGSPATMAIGLATQAGIGYINYRRSKAKTNLDYEKQQWQLQRSAIEQLNGLRRSLFETAWRLSDTYDFPDEWRLTEKQISQYNKILMDPDPHRQFERLDVLNDTFKAFPTFWYYKARCALESAEKYKNINREELCGAFKQKALDALNEYDNAYFPLMREDVIAASAALDKFSLLDPENDVDEMVTLLERAQKAGQSELDVLQMCAVNYIAICKPKPAVKILRNLVNEQYNIPLNAKLLSRLYTELDDRIEYDLLSDRVNPEYILPWAKTLEDSEKELLAFSKDQVAKLADPVLKKCVASVTQALGADFLRELGDWERTFPDEKLSWKEKVVNAEEFNQWSFRVQESFNAFFNDLTANPEYRAIFPNVKILAEKLQDLAHNLDSVLEGFEAALSAFQNKGDAVKKESSLLKSPKTSLISKYKKAGRELSQQIRFALEQLFDLSSEALLSAVKETLAGEINEETLATLKEALDEKNVSVSVSSVVAVKTDDELAENSEVARDYFGYRIFKE
ncbi:hypothetical protein PDESU_04404 [Pontiella desulfatans]|uniref:Uncharacterized protein n=1 Tax=Pontiella desulfatans TaxID=2750659 RepID=A0A6C2U7V7_PONDE|nr:hypothetical protein [Pontiella desulfatans]VGO15817.1 hypothetical protein PDESU_04404 [Pontiella desulfatans]